MFSNILVPLDGSGLAEEALSIAIKVAQVHNAQLHILRVAETEIMGVVPMHPQDTRFPVHFSEEKWEQGRTYIDAIAQQYSEIDRPIIPLIERGRPAETILLIAEDREIDLIIMSTHGRSGLSRWAFGSVTERVLRHATCPVLTIRSAQTIKQILVTLDGSKLAESVIQPTIEIARVLGAEITLLKVAEPQAPDLATVATLEHVEHGLGDNIVLAEYSRAQDYVQQVAHRHQREDVSIHAAVTEGHVAKGILNVADQIDFDMIAMSTHGRSGIRRWVYGSVTEKVLRAYKGSMLVLRPEAEESYADQS